MNDPADDYQRFAVTVTLDTVRDHVVLKVIVIVAGESSDAVVGGVISRRVAKASSHHVGC